jgi:hypothetical protein
MAGRPPAPAPAAAVVAISRPSAQLVSGGPVARAARHAGGTATTARTVQESRSEFLWVKAGERRHARRGQCWPLAFLTDGCARARAGRGGGGRRGGSYRPRTRSLGKTKGGARFAGAGRRRRPARVVVVDGGGGG